MCKSPEALAAFPCKAQVFEVDHSITTLAILLEMGGKVIVYRPDTGYCENAVKSACNADLLIAECALRSGEDIPDWPHLNPETAAQLAGDAGVKQMALIHFDAERYHQAIHRRGSKRRYESHFIMKLTDCDGESSETDTWLDFAKDCGYLGVTDYERLSEKCNSVGKMLGGMLNNPAPFLMR